MDEMKVEIWKLRKAVMAVLVNKPPSIMMQEEILKAGEPVVRLSAVDTLLAEAVWAMEALKLAVEMHWAEILDEELEGQGVQVMAAKDSKWQRAQAFLAIPAVLDYLARVGGTHGT